MIEEVTKENYNEFVNSQKLSIVKIGATWCGPCKVVAPILESVSNKNITTDVAIGDMDDLQFLNVTIS